MSNTFFTASSVVTVSLEDWMKSASGQADAKWQVVLPMIQRGSVWAPHKLLDLWDTLLRGMPIGAMMASESKEGKSVKQIGLDETRQSEASDIDLIDGQQRTLSMLAGWPQGLENRLRPVAIWVDLFDAAQGEYQFRLWATTKTQPFGYARASIGGQALSKLERSKLRLANQAWKASDALTLWKRLDFMPWEAKFALPLSALIANRNTLGDFVQDRLESYKKALSEKIAGATSTESEISPQVSQHFVKKLNALPTKADLAKCIPALEMALGKVLACQFPVIHVRQESFEETAINSPDVNTDPPLAILFKRVGTGGEPLSNADYVYAVIKHHAPGAHDTVESLLRDERIRAIYTPTSLVMSAVRLTMLSWKTENSKGQMLTDSAKLDKASFARLLRNHPGFIDQFHDKIKPNGAFATSLKQVLDNMSYSADFTTGLPKHALSLVRIPLLETILAWHALRAHSTDLEKSRLPMVRFALQGNLCALDYAKASEAAIKVLRENDTMLAAEIFPDQALLGLLATAERPTVSPLPSPSTLSAIDALTASPADINGLRGWTRFVVGNDADKDAAEIYKRWWNRKGGHVHPLLLWLQRDYVFETFEATPALAGMDEETPFDFDHILPSAQWASWTGVRGENKFIDFPARGFDGKILDNSGHRYIGNSIGNIHVLESSLNRELGDKPVRIKLTDGFAKHALIQDKHKAAWLIASGDEKAPRKWDEARALAFQRAVEQRSFALYCKFYDDLFPIDK